MKRLLVVTLLTLHSATAVNTIHDYIERYAVEPEVAAILDKHSNEIYKKLLSTHKGRKQHGVWQFSWLPGYYVKYGLERVWGMELMKRCIEEHNLDLLTLPDKRIYHVKGRPNHVTNFNYAVVIKKVRENQRVPMTLEQAKQLSTLISHTKFISLTRPNYLHLKDGRICLIDTESNYDCKQEVKGYLRMLGYLHNLNKDYTQEALKHVFYEMKQLLKKDPSKARQTLSAAEDYLKHQRKPHAWDYLGYFRKYFADMR